MVWSASGTTVTINNTTRTTHSLSDASGDGVPTSGTPRIAQLNSRHNVWEVYGYRIAITDGQSLIWDEDNATVIHTGPGIGGTVSEALYFFDGVVGSRPSTSDSIMRFGTADLTDADKPILTDGCHYLLDQERGSSATSVYGWNNTTGGGSEQPGNPEFYGGIFEVWPIQGTSATTGIFFQMPDGTNNFLGVNFCRWGGARWTGTDFRLQECRWFGGARLGISLLSTNDPVGTKDVVMGSIVRGYYFSNFQNGDTVFRDAATRDAPLSVAGAFVADGFIIDSDEVTEIQGTTISGTASGLVFEMNSYAITCLAQAAQPLATGAPTAGDGIQTCHIRVVRTDTTETADETLNVTTENQFGNTSSSVLQTNSSGVMETDTVVTEEIFLTRVEWEANDNISQGEVFSGFFTLIRRYGFDFVRLPKFPEGGQGAGLVDVIQMRPDPFLVTAEATVAALTGIDYTFQPDDEIDLTESHTLQEVYDYTHWFMSQEAQMEDVATGDHFTGLNEVILPLSTQDGNVFILTTGAGADADWVMTNVSANLDIEDKILELANGDRWVPIILTGMPENTQFSVTNDDAGDVVLYEGSVPDDGLDKFQTKRLFTGTNINVTITARLQGFLPFKQSGLIGAGGLIVPVNLSADPTYRVNEGRMGQTAYRFRNDDGSESAATWKAAENTNITGQAKATNFRVRFQSDEISSKRIPKVNLKARFRKVGDASWEDLG